MNLPELFVIRHGETEWNHQGRLQGDLDSSLTTKGQDQARAMGQFLTREGITPQTHCIYSSPLGRARRTAELIFGSLDGIAEDARLREISVGHWTGLTREAIRAQSDLDEDAHFLEFYANAPGGEPMEQLFARVEGFLATLTAPSVIVTHGITSRVLRTLAMGWGPDKLTEVPGGQGVVHHVVNRQHAELRP